MPKVIVKKFPGKIQFAGVISGWLVLKDEVPPKDIDGEPWLDSAPKKDYNKNRIACKQKAGLE